VSREADVSEEHDEHLSSGEVKRWQR
jgi:hypothetical protein